MMRATAAVPVLAVLLVGVGRARADEEERPKGFFAVTQGIASIGTGACFEGTCSDAVKSPTVAFRMTWMPLGYRLRSRGGTQTWIGLDLGFRYAGRGLTGGGAGAEVRVERDGLGVGGFTLSYLAGVGLAGRVLEADAGNARATVLTLSLGARCRFRARATSPVQPFVLPSFEYGRTLVKVPGAGNGLPEWILAGGVLW